MFKSIFEQNQKCLSNIPEIVRLLRIQSFFEGNKRTKKLIEELNLVSDYIIKQQLAEVSVQNWMQILQAVLQAQQSRDYIMLADVLESDLLPLLQKIQLYLQENESLLLNEYWEKNISCLKRKNKILYDSILRDCKRIAPENSKVQYFPVQAINGQITLKALIDERELCLHSMVNPEWEARLLAESWVNSQEKEYQVFGIGIGYHIKVLLDEDDERYVTVLENRIEPLYLALTYIDWQQYLQEGRLRIVYEPDISLLLKYLRNKDNEHMFFVHYPSLQCVENKEIREALEDYFISVSSIQEQSELLKRNFIYLQKRQLHECEEMQYLFKEKKLVIVAGGPSVDREMVSLRKYRSEVVILAVGTVAGKLIDNGIKPDVIIITDAQQTMYHQIEGVNTEEIPLFLLSTASKSVVSYYRGPIYLVYQHGFKPAETVAEEKGYMLFQTGGSVTTTALDIGIRFNAKQIILVGADMAYTDNRSHAGGIGREIKNVSGLRQVAAVGGGIVYTSKNLDVYRKWIERRIAKIEYPVIYNTSKGAKIAGTVEMEIEKIMNI